MDVSIDRNPNVPLTLEVPQPDSKRSKPGEDVKLVLEKTSATRKPPPQQKPTFPPRPSAPPLQPDPRRLFKTPVPESRTTFEEFANPKKLKPTLDVDELNELSDLESPDFSDAEPANDEEEERSEYTVDEPEYEPLGERPSPGFSSIDEEKASLIFKLARAKKAGMPSTKNFSMASDIKDMRAEMARVDHELALDASIKFQRNMMMMVVSSLEHLNGRFDPFELQLQGWSDSVHGNLLSYDRVFERLHEKYKSRTEMAPEIELLLMIGGSAMMFHFTNTLIKSSQAAPGIGGIDPGVMTSMLSALTKKTNTDTSNATRAQESQLAQRPNQGKRREMRGPNMDLGGILGGALPFPPMGPPQISTQPSAHKSVAFAPGTKRPAEEMDGLIEDVDTDEDDQRLSDIVSEDLDAVPDDLSSFGGSDTTSEGDIRTVEVKRKRGRASKKSKTVVTL